MRWAILCFVLVCGRDAFGHSFGEQMSETIQQCCNEGATMAMTQSAAECNSQSLSDNVPAAFKKLCSMAKMQCCTEYYAKKQDCDTGVYQANIGACEGSNTEQLCCHQCIKGTLVGKDKGLDGCVNRNHSSAEELLANDAFVNCCRKAVKDDSTESKKVSPVTKRSHTIASLCEDYAPTELCAHHCIPIPGSYKCECNPGFMLMPDGKNCKEVEKNRCKPRNNCQHKCNDNGIEVLCSCRRGFELMADGKSCQDIDECQLDIPVCLPGMQCHNIQGSYKCISMKNLNKTEKGHCPKGFTRNSANNACDDINECKVPNPPCPEQICENTIGGYKCGGKLESSMTTNHQPMAPHGVTEDRCPAGFMMGIIGECEDVDECAINRDDCSRLSQFCINTHGSFHCQDQGSRHCPPGFKLAFTNKCEDINECEDLDACQKDQVCINQLGAYDCKQNTDSTSIEQKCPSGTRLNPATLICDDIDECAEGTHLCQEFQNCFNLPGSFDCHCKSGYELDVYSQTCIDVNECATGQHNCMSGSQRCDNTVGSFLCIRITSCGTGYILQHSSGNCEDIDECALGTHNCARAGPEYQCLNIPGSFRCVRKRASTTQAPLDYEYEYYDSDEVFLNKTDAKSDKPIHIDFSSTQKPKSSAGIPVTSPKSTNFDKKNWNTYAPASSKKEENNFKLDIRTTTPFPDTDPVIFYSEPPTDPPKTKSSISIYYETKDPSSNEIVPKKEYTTDPISVVVPSEGSRPMYSPFKPTQAPTQKKELVDSLSGDKNKNEPGSEEKAVTDNGFKVSVPPRDCPPGFEINDYGGCFDIDECATNRHSCSGFTETCRNTIGGYLCDCAPGFRRDMLTAACDLILTSSSTTPSTYTGPNSIPTISYDSFSTMITKPTTSSTTPTSPSTSSSTIPSWISSTIPSTNSFTILSTSTSTSTSNSTTTSTTTETSLSPPDTYPTTPATAPTHSTSKNYFWGYRDDRRMSTRPFVSRRWCDGGHHFNQQTGNCEDIDECSNGQANCAAVEICVNTEGGYRCECPPNWALDEFRHRCLPARSQSLDFPPGFSNQPRSSPPVTAYKPLIPTNMPVEPQITPVKDSGTLLKCPWGYQLGADHNCVDIDECSDGAAMCGSTQICTNLPGTYTCSCASGFQLVAGNLCEDINECETQRASICSEHAECINTPGSYQCKCRSGFKPAPFNDKVCMDVDECSDSRNGTLCQHRCNNVWGSYACSCYRGYRLNPDNRTCTDVDECLQFKSKIPCVGQCYNEPGSYRCDCPPGYRLSEDKRSCIDIDECETGEANCRSEMYLGTSTVCFNTRGSFRCHRITCPSGYQLESKHRCSKADRQCPPGDYECAHLPTTISFNYITFVSKLYIPSSKVKLFTMRGPSWPNANMKFALRLVDVNAPPSVDEKADINYFLLLQNDNEAVMSLVRPLEGPQSIELELSMELYSGDQFGGIALAKIFIHVSEYEY